MKDTQIVILNWNNAVDTVESIKSILADDVYIAILDNNSTDDSVAIIKRMLEETLVSVAVINTDEIERLYELVAKVIIIKSGKNLGFAKGVNVVLRQVLNNDAIQYAWLLNNDAIAKSDALQKMKKTIGRDDSIAFSGSLVMDYYDRDKVQCCGVKYYKYFGVSKLILKNVKWSEVDKANLPLSEIDYLNGASLLVKMDVVREIGLLDERYFLYSEEHDWQYRAEKAGYKNELAVDSVVYHKGSMSTNAEKFRFFYYYNKSAILFSRAHYNIFIALLASCMLTVITLQRTKLNMKSLGWGMRGIGEAWTNK
jgi:GT2 family glycosyltransferase